MVCVGKSSNFLCEASLLNEVTIAIACSPEIRKSAIAPLPVGVH